VIAGFAIGVVAAIVGVAGGQLFIPDHRAAVRRRHQKAGSTLGMPLRPVARRSCGASCGASSVATAPAGGIGKAATANHRGRGSGPRGARSNRARRRGPAIVRGAAAHNSQYHVMAIR
jgi:hypothetical protein